MLRLYPAERLSDPLVGRLVVGNLDQDLSYQVLSYTYGSAFDTQQVADDIICMLEGNQIPIPGNLAQGLRRMRSKTEVVPLWIDAICIDHENIEERNSQVQLNHIILREASKVTAWLGEDSQFEEADYVYTFCKAFEYGKLAEGTEEEIKEFVTQFRAQWLRKKKRDTRGLLCHFISRRYFRRRWVVQELCGAAQVDVRCGPHVLPWHVFLAGIEALRGGPQSDQNCQREIRTILDGPVHVAKKNGIPTEDPCKVLETLCLSRDLSCRNEKDRVFALTSLWKLPGFTVDYRMSVETTYRQLAKALVNEAGRRNDGATICKLLAVSAYQARDRRNISISSSSSGIKNDLPSWAPDWRFRAPNTLSISRCGPSSPAKIDGGKALRLVTRTFGMIDALNAAQGTLHLLRHRSLNEKEFKATVVNRRSQQSLQNTTSRIEVDVTEEECAGLEDGDLLCYPVVWDYGQKSDMAIVMRPGIEGHVVKCQVVGQFPLKALGGTPDTGMDMEVVLV